MLSTLMQFNMENIFDKQKYACLKGVDFSRKGSIDSQITDLVTTINGRNNYFTTSSCSGRIIVFENPSEGIKKKSCKWLFTSHEAASLDNVIGCLQNHKGNAVFKFEPMILHVQSRTLNDAQKLLQCAVASGFRNSGISVGNKGKIVTAVRNTNSLEVPLSLQGTLMVSEQYLEFLTKLANDKMTENFHRISRFSTNLSDLLDIKDSEDAPDTTNNSTKMKDKSDKKKTECVETLNNPSTDCCDNYSVDAVDVLSECFLLEDTVVT